MEGCVHLESYRKYKKKIQRSLIQKCKYACNVCGLNFHVHECLDCNSLFCFNDLKTHFCESISDKQDIREKKYSIPTFDVLKTNKYDPFEMESHKSEIVHGFLTNNFDFVNKNTVKSETSLVSQEASSIGQSFRKKNSGVKDIVETSTSSSGISGKKCDGLFFNTQLRAVYCFKCKKYLKFSKLSEQVLQRKYVVKNQKNYARMQFSYIKGLQNMGNSCYINAILQIFLNLAMIKKRFFDGSHEKISCKEKMCLICSIKGIFIDSFSTTSSLIPNEFLYSFFSKMKSKYNAEQFDSHEFFLDLCQTIHEESNEPEETCTCITHSIFNGRTRSTLTCSKCQQKSVTEEQFNSLSIYPIKNVNVSFLSYFKEETFENFHCKNCDSTESAIKSLQISKFPETLCVHLKRYKSTGSSISKNTENIELTEILDAGNKFYKLFGVICHYGELKSGHYISYIQRDNQWLKFDDETVTISKFSEIPQDVSYILFYKLE